MYMYVIVYEQRLLTVAKKWDQSDSLTLHTEPATYKVLNQDTGACSERYLKCVGAR